MSNEQQQQGINITDEQMSGAIGAGIQFLNLETTLIPGNIRKQLAVLEVVLQGLGQGALVIASPDQLKVKSKPTGSPAVKDGVGKATGARNAESHRSRKGKK